MSEPSLCQGVRSLPDHIKSRILSHLSCSKTLQNGSLLGITHGSAASYSVQLQGKQLERGALVVDEFVPQNLVKQLKAEAQSLMAAKARSAGMGGTQNPWKDGKFRGDSIVFLSPRQLHSDGYLAVHSFLETVSNCLWPWLEKQGYNVAGRPTMQLGCYPGEGSRYVRHRDASLSCPHRTITAIVYLNEGWGPPDGGQLCIYHHGTVASTCCQEAAAQPCRRPGGGHAALSCDPSPRNLAAQVPEELTHANLPDKRYLPEQCNVLEGSLPGDGRAHEEHPVRSGLEEGHAATVIPPIAGRLVLFESHLEHEVLPCYAPRYAFTIWFTCKADTADSAAASFGEQSGAHNATSSARPDASASARVDAELPGRMKQLSVGHTQQVLVEGAEEGESWQHKLQQGVETSEGRLRAAQLEVVQPASGPHKPISAARLASGPPDTVDRVGRGFGMGCITRPGSVFVSIASYRDSETQWTLLDLFSKADQPDLLRVGVVWQVDWSTDAHFVRMAPGGEARMPQVRQAILPHTEATGPCKARSMAEKLWDGEGFFLQIDSHMRFVPGWDTLLLSMLGQAEQAAQHSRVVLSTYPAAYQGEGCNAVLQLDPPATLLCASHFDLDGMLRIKGRALRCAPLAPKPSLFWAAGFSFSRAQLLLEAPYDPTLSHLFFGEEMHQLATMWRLGWDVYAPQLPVVFHLWSRTHRPTFHKDHLRGLVCSGAALGGNCVDASCSDRKCRVGQGGERPTQTPLAKGIAGSMAETTSDFPASGKDLDVNEAPGDVLGDTSSPVLLRQMSQQRVLESLTQDDTIEFDRNQSQHTLGVSSLGISRDSTNDRRFVRSLQQLYQYCGVDFARRVIEERAMWGGCSPDEFKMSF